MCTRRTLASITKLFGFFLPAVAIMLFVSTPGLGIAQEAKTKEVKVTKAPIVRSDPASGKQMYLDYCTPCHGLSGTGNGPAAPALKVQPANLTLLAKNNRGNYPADHVTNVLKFGTQTPVHGSKDMPVWGRLFASLSASSGTERAESELRIQKLSDYIETLQTR